MKATKDVAQDNFLSVIISVIKHHGQEQAGDERAYLFYTSTLLCIIGKRTGKQAGQGPGGSS